ncbi:MAG: porin family protein [Gammaproteobacteria bacterium]|nr:porin family protein [Gammaproteobacteria bacterium]MDH5652522.1 porin family protein [Gammaproteobacteria bacterium]
MRFVKIMSLCLIFGIFSPVAQAAGAYFGVKGGFFEVENSNYDKAVNGGIIVGAHFIASSVHTVSLEGELTTTVLPGDITGGNEWEIDTFGLFGAFRAGSGVYFKGKMGYIDRSISYKFGGVSDRNSLAYGIGFGIRRGTERRIEVEYTIIDDDNTFTDIKFLSIGLIF